LAKILLLEDDLLLGETIVDVLEDAGHTVSWLKDGESAIEESYEGDFDLYLLDIKVPKIDGLKLLSLLREAEDTTPAIILTSFDDKKTLTEGFKMGCDDYMKKPFDIDELILRMSALLKRNQKETKRVVTENILFDIENKRVFVDGEEKDLSQRCIALLEYLIKRRGEIVKKEEIYTYLWEDEEPKDGVLRVYINQIKKIYGKESIANIRGVGYRFEK